MKKKVKHNIAKKKVEEEEDVSVSTANEGEVSAGDESAQEKRRLRIFQSDSCFLEFLNKDRRAVPSFCDISVSVRGEMYPAHKVVLAFGSSYFHAKLSENPQLDHVTFDNVDGSTFKHLLDFLYTSEMEVQQSQIPSLSEAACFFDMMEAVNLLVGEATPNQTPEEGEKEDKLPMEEPLLQSSSSGEHKKPQSPGETQCLLCSRTFCYKKSLENHMVKMHSQADATDTSSKRTSTRQRRRPSKFQSLENKNPVGMEHRGKNVDEGATSVEENDDDDDEEDGDDEDGNGEENQHNQSKEREDTETNLEEETGLRTEEDADGRKEEEEEESESSSSSHVTKDHDASVAQSSGGHVYPEGLAPVIIQNGNKKALKCPKCDKTFDRIGESLNAAHIHCV